jgi:hypothetical protein
MDATDINSARRYCGVDAYSLLYGAALTFDVTNPNPLDIRIVRFFVDVIKFVDVDIIGVWQNGKGGGMKVRAYTCEIEPMIGRYECNPISTGFDYIRLSPGEMEAFRINIETVVEGIYGLRLGMEYSIGGESKIAEIDSHVKQIGLFDPVFHEPSFDWGEREVSGTDTLSAGE